MPDMKKNIFFREQVLLVAKCRYFTDFPVIFDDLFVIFYAFYRDFSTILGDFLTICTRFFRKRQVKIVDKIAEKNVEKSRKNRRIFV